MVLENTLIHRWLVLIPHRDSLRTIHELQSRLWQSGVRRARLLPPMAFIAPVLRPAKAENLQALAQLMRKRSLEQSREGYIDGKSLGYYSLPGGIDVLGLPLSPELTADLSQVETDTPIPAENLPVPSPLLITALQGSQGELELAQGIYRELPPFRFRHGAVANLAFTLTGKEGSCTTLRWELGKPCWMAHCG